MENTQQQEQLTVKKLMLDVNSLKKRKEALERDLKIINLQLERDWEILEDTFVNETMNMGLAFEEQMTAAQKDAGLAPPPQTEKPPKK